MSTKVFISWSGELSKKLAEATRQWLPGVLQFVQPYFTPEDIEKGARWGSDIVGELESSEIGIICLTKENIERPWILFEAGALSKSLEKARVCTVLFDLDTTDLKGPLTIFQHTKFQQDEFKKLVKTVNNAAGDAKLEDPVLDNVFDMWWPKLKEAVDSILANRNDDAPANRSERDMLEEILELSRLSSRNRKHERELHPEVLVDLLDGVQEIIRTAAMKGGQKRLAMAMRYLERPLMHLSHTSRVPELEERFFMMRKELEMMLDRESSDDG